MRSSHTIALGCWIAWILTLRFQVRRGRVDGWKALERDRRPATRSLAGHEDGYLFSGRGEVCPLRGNILEPRAVPRPARAGLSRTLS